MLFLIISLAVAFLLLMLRYFHVLRELKGIVRTSKEIQAGNLNLRYRLHTSQKDMEELGGTLNRLMDYFQEALERTRFLEDERKRMIADISHDLRTPLTSLLGYLEALEHDETLTIEERAAFLRIAADKGNTLLSLLQDFFELARLEAEDSVPDAQRINFTEIAHETILSFYHDFVQAGITPAVGIPEAPLYVRGDAACLRRILNNLLSNALRYGRDGREVGISLREAPDLVWMDIWDRGKGIPAQDLPRIFERLYTGEASRNNSLRGTGLGLTIVKNLVEKQGGRITATSTPNEKTVFSFCLPKG